MVKSEKWQASGSEMSGGVKNSDQQKAQQAQWNVQVVRGKVTTRCLWNACKALSIGLLLLTIGTTMAVIGYYADQLSIRSETRGNFTVKIKNESRGFHLNNLSYVGPIVMGIGGFIVVAACVMTFEARDSAAKVVPARFKPNLNASITAESTKPTPRSSRNFQRMESKRSASVQTPAGGKCPRMYKPEPSGSDWSPKNDIIGKRAFTAAFVQLSREFMENSDFEGHRKWRRKMSEANLNKSPSAPDLAVEISHSGLQNRDCAPLARRRLCRGSPNAACRVQRESVRPPVTVSSNILLRPSYLKRQALSMDNPFYEGYECYTPPSLRLSRQHSRRSGGSGESVEMELGSSVGVSGSQTSMALDLHDYQVTLKVKDESANKRSDTAKRHQLLRQKPVEDDAVSRCSCASRVLCNAVAEETKAKSSLNLKSPCHHCLRATTSCSGRGHSPKMSAAYRSQSFSPTCSFYDPKRSSFHGSSSKIFCIDDHRRTNLSSENIRPCCCEEKLRHLRRHSPSASPNRSHECRAQQLEGSECLVHGGCALARHKGRRRKGGRKMEGSLSAEERNVGGPKRAEHARSASFSPTRKSPSREGSSSPGKQSCSSVAGDAKEEKKEIAEPS